MANRIAKKINRSEKDLLITNTDEFRLKKEVKEILDIKKTDYDRYGQNAW